MGSTPELMTLAQWGKGQPWRLGLTHSVDAHGFIWITRGQGRCIVEGIRRGLGAHNALIIPAGTLFSLELGTQGYGQVCLIPAGSALLMPDRPYLLRIRDVQAQAEVTSLLDTMKRELDQDRPFNDEARYAYGHLMTVWLRRMIIDKGGSPHKPSAAERLAMAFCALVERDYTKGLPMAHYARTLGVTPTHLTRICNQTCGMTAADILTERTLHAARVMLADTADPIKAIAAQLGFSSAAYFTRFIQNHTGKTPSALR